MATDMNLKWPSNTLRNVAKNWYALVTDSDVKKNEMFREFHETAFREIQNRFVASREIVSKRNFGYKLFNNNRGIDNDKLATPRHRPSPSSKDNVFMAQQSSTSIL